MAQKHTLRERQQERYDLAGEHAAGKVGQIVVLCLFAAMWISDTFFLGYTTFLNYYAPPAIRIPLGIILLILSLDMAGKGLHIVFDEKREGPGVIRESVFNVVRHPIYLSEILLYLGLLMLSISLAAVFVWVITILFFHHISRYEEKLLFARFGKEYEQYMREVPMWFPRVRKR